MDGAHRASPLARKLAAEKGVALTRIVGTGHHGRILRADVIAAAAAGARADRRAPSTLSVEATELSRRILAHGLGPDDDPSQRVAAALGRLPGGRGVTVTAPGSHGDGDRLEVGAPRLEPVVRRGRLEVGRMLPLRLTTDGRGIDPASAEALLDALALELEG